MTKHVTRMAGAVAAATSRRGFLGRLARLAGGAAAGVAGVLTARTAEAGAGKGKGPKAHWCCQYGDGGWGPVETHCTNRKSCPEQWGGLPLLAAWRTDDCSNCF